eukprot:TRINITY_DN17316_c0_g1_i1.p1 TRINITY_DN17316_c0_g1~~TRINITY_DN17316_c0_g1_i1.p1  ORF type:complete len:262 (-),score=48.44 TRINITY_DN17316_c0_g1_i1:62-823(-)
MGKHNASWHGQWNGNRSHVTQRDWKHSKKAAGSEDKDKMVSKYLSCVLRHEAVKLNLTMRSDGYVPVDEVLALDFFTTRGLGYEDIKALVDRNEKQRFGLKEIDGENYVRAHQGHTLKLVQDENLLTEIRSHEELPVLCHGTYFDAWQQIQTEGIRTMTRNHIHLKCADLSSEENMGTVMSGTRGEVEVIVYIDVEKAMAEGIKFQKSDNEVVLTRGHNFLDEPDQGFIPTHLFSLVKTWDYEAEDWTIEDLS